MNRACIIGAGASGLVAAKTLHERGLPFDCFEKGSDVGGLWRYDNDNGMSSIYRSLHVNTSRGRMDFSDFPMPDGFPDFPHHTEVLAYFEAYVDHFGFRDRITFRTEVVRVADNDKGSFDVTVRGIETGETETRTYGAVLVANGHHWDPHLPTFPGTFDGLAMHSHDYRTPDVLSGKRVLVVGVGNSGCDIVCEAARVAERAYLSTRRGAHVTPKYLLGRPLDSFVSPVTARLPYRLQNLTASVLLFLTRGRQSWYGFPTPDEPYGALHPTVSSDLLNLVGHGKIDVRPNVERLAGGRVRFTDGSEAAVDVIVYATGYNLSFPFFDDGFLTPEANHLPLFLHVAPPDVPNLYFIGLVQPVGALMPLAEVQARWVADVLGGRAGLPTPEAMRDAIRKREKRDRKRYVHSRRHTIEVDFYPYKRAVEEERKKGRKRAPEQALAAARGGRPVSGVGAAVATQRAGE